MLERTEFFEIPDRTFDLLVVGLGPAGMACALQAHRDGLDVLAVGDEPVGGLVRAARRLSNLPAEPGISGMELAARMEQQARGLPLSLAQAHVSQLHRAGPGFVAGLSDGRQVEARAVTLATGTRPREWDLSTGGRPVLRDARPLPDLLEGQTVAVIGGGEAALDTALTCRDRGAHVTVLARGERLRAVAQLLNEAEAAGVEIRTGIRVKRVGGGPGSWCLTCLPGGDLEASWLVVCIGREPRDDLLQRLLPDGYQAGITQDQVPGLTLAGDLIRGRDRYVATAMGDGQRAAIAAAVYLQEEDQ